MGDIDEVKSRINIVDLIGSRLTLKKAGRNFKALCPFHNEKTPSFMVSPERGSWHCFGCGKGGSAIDWVMEYEHVDFVEALETLADKAGVKLERRYDQSPEGKLKEIILAANHLAGEYFRYILTTHPMGEKARQYLKNRGVSDKTAATFGLGYAPNSWDGLLKFLGKKGYDTKLLVQAGLVVESKRGGYDRFRGRLMFPQRTHRGIVVGFSGRVLDPAVKEAKYINTSDTPVYSKSNILFGFDITKDAVVREGFVILMEGEFDIISSFQEGIPNVVAIKGSALTEGHVHLLKRFTERIVFCLDADPAGDAASRRGMELADRAGFDMRVVDIPGGKDPDEAVRENVGLFKTAVKKAEPIYDYLIRSVVKRFDATSAFGKKKISEELSPILSRIDNPVVRAHYVKKTAETLDITEDIVESEMIRAVKQSVIFRADSKQEKTMQKDVRDSIDTMEIYLLAMILQTNTRDMLEELVQLGTDGIHQPAVRRIVTLLHEYMSKTATFFIRDFADTLPNEFVKIFDEAFLWDLSDSAGNEEETAREWTWALMQYQRLRIKNELKILTSTMTDAPEDADQATVSRIRELTEQLRTLEKSQVV